MNLTSPIAGAIAPAGAAPAAGAPSLLAGLLATGLGDVASLLDFKSVAAPLFAALAEANPAGSEPMKGSEANAGVAQGEATATSGETPGDRVAAFMDSASTQTTVIEAVPTQPPDAKGAGRDAQVPPDTKATGTSETAGIQPVSSAVPEAAVPEASVPQDLTPARAPLAGNGTARGSVFVDPSLPQSFSRPATGVPEHPAADAQDVPAETPRPRLTRNASSEGKSEPAPKRQGGSHAYAAAVRQFSAPAVSAEIQQGTPLTVSMVAPPITVAAPTSESNSGEPSAPPHPGPPSILNNAAGSAASAPVPFLSAFQTRPDTGLAYHAYAALLDPSQKQSGLAPADTETSSPGDQPLTALAPVSESTAPQGRERTSTEPIKRAQLDTSESKTIPQRADQPQPQAGVRIAAPVSPRPEKQAGEIETGEEDSLAMTPPASPPAAASQNLVPAAASMARPIDAAKAEPLSRFGVWKPVAHDASVEITSMPPKSGSTQWKESRPAAPEFRGNHDTASPGDKLPDLKSRLQGFSGALPARTAVSKTNEPGISNFDPPAPQNSPGPDDELAPFPSQAPVKIASGTQPLETAAEPPAGPTIAGLQATNAGATAETAGTENEFEQDSSLTIAAQTAIDAPNADSAEFAPAVLNPAVLNPAAPAVAAMPTVTPVASTPRPAAESPKQASDGDVEGGGKAAPAIASPVATATSPAPQIASPAAAAKTIASPARVETRHANNPAGESAVKVAVAHKDGETQPAPTPVVTYAAGEPQPTNPAQPAPISETETSQRMDNSRTPGSRTSRAKDSRNDDPAPGFDPGNIADHAADSRHPVPLRVDAPSATGGNTATSVAGGAPGSHATKAPHASAVAGTASGSVPGIDGDADGLDTGLTAGHPSIKDAKLIQGSGQLEFRVGMLSREFGNIDIRTSVERHQFSAQISVEHGEIAKSLAADLPALYNRLADRQVPVAQVLIQNQTASTSSGSGFAGNAQSHTWTGQHGTFSSTQDESLPTAIPDALEAGGRLDIRI